VCLQITSFQSSNGGNPYAPLTKKSPIHVQAIVPSSGLHIRLPLRVKLHFIHLNTPNSRLADNEQAVAEQSAGACDVYARGKLPNKNLPPIDIILYQSGAASG